MKLIKTNPYRTIGLLVGAKAAEQARQINRLKMYLEAEQEPQGDFSFPILGKIYRTVDSVTEASSKLNLDTDRLNAALFWFYKGNPITDEPAFDALKDSDFQTAIDIWLKLTGSGEVTQRNTSAFQNLSTLLLCHGLDDSKVDINVFEYGLSLKLQFLESDFINDLKTIATDETFKPTKKEIQLAFLHALEAEIEKNSRISPSQLIDIINKHNFSAKDDFLKGFVQKPIEQIERRIDEAKAKRKSSKANADKAGNTLFEQTKEDLSQISSILSTSNLKFSAISDKVSDEILQCGIDYFQYHRDSSTNPGRTSMDLFRKAKTLAIGNIAKQRCQENTENLQEWIDDEPERIKQQRIINDLEKLKRLIDEYEEKSETVANAKQLLASAKTCLNNIKATLGGQDELYLGLSSRIASDAQGMCVSEINKLQEKFSSAHDNNTKIVVIVLLKERVDEAWEVTTTIGAMDLRSDFRNLFTANKNSLSNLKSQLSKTNTGSSGGGGCYIATMAYGDHNHPQVMILRQFRDNVLAKSAFGKCFIKTYYHYSPKLVEKLKNSKLVNSIIRKTLNQIIKLIK